MSLAQAILMKFVRAILIEFMAWFSLPDLLRFLVNQALVRFHLRVGGVIS